VAVVALLAEVEDAVAAERLPLGGCRAVEIACQGLARTDRLGDDAVRQRCAAAHRGASDAGTRALEPISRARRDPCGMTEALGRDRAELAHRTIEALFAPDGAIDRVEDDRGAGTADRRMATPAGFRMPREVGGPLEKRTVPLDLLLERHPDYARDVCGCDGVRVIRQYLARAAVRADDPGRAVALDAEILEDRHERGWYRHEREQLVAVGSEVPRVTSRVTGIERAESLADDALEAVSDHPAASKVSAAARHRAPTMKNDRRREGDGDERSPSHAFIFRPSGGSRGAGRPRGYTFGL